MSKAKLFIKGQKEPIELEEEEARQAQSLITSSKPHDTAFAIEGIWAGRKADMRYVIFPKKEKEPVARKAIVPMTLPQAEAFEVEIEQDREEARKVYGAVHVLTDGKEIDMGIKWPEFYYQRKGAIRLEIKKREGEKPFINWLMRDSFLFQQLEDTIESYWEFTRKRDYAEGKKMEQYDVMAGMEELKAHMTS